jgi:hypothetical protein
VRSDSLFLQGSITQAELDEAEKERAVGQSDRQNAETELTAASSSRINLLQAALSQAKLALDDAARALARTVITASVGGVVIDPVVHERGNASPGEPLMRLITGTTRPTAEVRVDEGELAWLRPGQKAYVTCSSCATVDATVQSVIGRIDTTTLTAAVVLEMPQSQPPLIAGRKIFVRILSEGSPGTILLDRRFVSSQESRMYVFIKSGNRALRRLVRSEVIGDEIISIRSGLTPVDTLLYAAGLSECSRIRLNRKPFDAVHFPGL